MYIHHGCNNKADAQNVLYYVIIPLLCQNMPQPMKYCWRSCPMSASFSDVHLLIRSRLFKCMTHSSVYHLLIQDPQAPNYFVWVFEPLPIDLPITRSCAQQVLLFGANGITSIESWTEARGQGWFSGGHISNEGATRYMLTRLRCSNSPGTECILVAFFERTVIDPAVIHWNIMISQMILQWCTFSSYMCQFKQVLCQNSIREWLKLARTLPLSPSWA